MNDETLKSVTDGMAEFILSLPDEKTRLEAWRAFLKYVKTLSIG